MHSKDQVLLEGIQSFLGGVGKITKQRKDSIQFRVFSRHELELIIGHFNKYPLLTQKRADFELFKKAFDLISREEHLTTKGLEKLIAIKASVNNGLSPALKAAFPDIIPASRPLVLNQEIKDPNWLAGFAEGEACFSLRVVTSEKSKAGARVWLRFQLAQHGRDEQLMRRLVEYLGCGHYYTYASTEVGEFIVERLADITEKIIPFFVKYPLLGAKAKDFAFVKLQIDFELRFVLSI